MRQYLDAAEKILNEGTRKENRTGVDTLSTFGVHYNIDLQRGFPLLTTKAINFAHIVVEMLWFLSGKTDIGILRKHDFKFWESWVGKDGKAPSPYGYFWRNFPVHGPLKERGLGDQPSPTWSDLCAFNDQLAWVVDTLKRDPMSRRMVVSAWAPGNAQTSKLPPCHCLFVVNVQNVERHHIVGGQGTEDMPPMGEQRLCLHLTQRSADIALGVPYNIASYALLMHLLSRFSGIPVGTFSHTLVDAHAYTAKPDGSKAEFDHVPGLREQLVREPRRLPTLTIDPSITSLADVDKLIELPTAELMALFKLDGYEPWPAIKFKVAV